MGYYTNYEIEEEETGDTRVIEEVKKESGYDWSDNYLTSVKWYDWGEDCIKVSKRFPDSTILLKGNGEEDDDVWMVRVKNGRITWAKRKVTWSWPDE